MACAVDCPAVAITQNINVVIRRDIPHRAREAETPGDSSLRLATARQRGIVPWKFATPTRLTLGPSTRSEVVKSCTHVPDSSGVNRPTRVSRCTEALKSTPLVRMDPKFRRRDIDQLQAAGHACRKVFGGRCALERLYRRRGFQPSAVAPADGIPIVSSTSILPVAGSQRANQSAASARTAGSTAERVRARRLQVRIAARSPDRNCKLAVASGIGDGHWRLDPRQVQDRRVSGGRKLWTTMCARSAPRSVARSPHTPGLKASPTSE